MPRRFLRGCADDAYDVIIIDVFDATSELPPQLSTPEFAGDVMRVSRRGVSANLVGETTLDTEAGCESMARNLGDACVRRGGDCFISPDPTTDNALFVALFGGGGGMRRRAARRGRRAGVLFDCGAVLGDAAPCASGSEVVARLRAGSQAL